MKFLDIKTVSEASGLPPSTLRYYEEVGLISSVARHGLRRQYEPQVLLQLSIVAMGKSAGFSLEDISGIFGKDGKPDLPRADLHARADALDKQIEEMTALSKALRHVAECSAPSHLECQTFQRLLRIASKRNPARKIKNGNKQPK